MELCAESCACCCHFSWRLLHALLASRRRHRRHTLLLNGPITADHLQVTSRSLAVATYTHHQHANTQSKSCKAACIRQLHRPRSRQFKRLANIGMSHWQSRQFQNCSEVKSFPKLSILHADEAVLDRSDLLCEDDSYNGADSSSLHWPIFDAHTADTSGSSSHSNDFDPLAAHMNRDGLVSRHTGEGSADSGICKGRFDASNHSMASRRSTREVHNLSRDQSILSIPHSSRVISTISSNGGGWTASDGAFTADGISDYHHGSTTTSLPLKLETLAFQDAETSALPPLDTTLGGPKATSSSSIASSGPELYSSPESDGGLCSDYPRDNRPSSSSGSRRSLRHHMAGDISSVAGGSMHGNCDKDILDLRKTRHKCTADQLLQLQAFFETNRNPKGKVREELANRLGMPERSVQIWFQNK